MKVWWIITLSLLLSLPVAAPTTTVFVPAPPTFTEMAQAVTNCAPLPAPPAGDTIANVSTEAQLWTAVNEAQPHTTILLADGTYNLGANGHYVWIATPYVTLRSASGNREAVILDDNYSALEIVSIAASNVTVADITIKRAYTHPIHVMSTDTADTLNTLIYNVHITDPGEQAIKVNPAGAGYYPDNGVIACSTIELTDAGRPHIRDDCYTGGIDMHQARDWVVRDNVIEGFWCSSGLSEHGIHFWRGCRDPIVERNVLRNNARGVGFGMATDGIARTYADDPCPDASGYIDHYGGIIRNNFIFANRAELFASADGYDNGISLWNACEVETYHNSVISTQAPLAASIEWRFPNTSVDLVNNLVSHNLLARDDATATQAGNLASAALALFVDGSGGDLHILPSAAAAIDQGAALSAGLCDDDIDGDARPIGSARDIGADEYGIPTPDAVKDLRLLQAVLDGGTLTVTLHWTPPTGAVTTTVRYAAQPIAAANWDAAPDFATGGVLDTATNTIPYDSGTRYFALRTHNEGGWSALSNLAFWPHNDVYLPLVMR